MTRFPTPRRTQGILDKNPGLHLANQILKRTQGCTCTTAGGNDDLLALIVGDVTRGENALGSGMALCIHLDFTAMIGIKQVEREIGIGI